MQPNDEYLWFSNKQIYLCALYSLSLPLQPLQDQSLLNNFCAFLSILFLSELQSCLPRPSFAYSSTWISFVYHTQQRSFASPSTFPNHLISVLNYYLQLKFKFKFPIFKQTFAEVFKTRSPKGRRMSSFNIFTGKCTEKKPLGRPRRRWKDSIRMDLQRNRCQYWELDWLGSG